ncbi:MAG: N-acetyltransferase [Spirochaetaceae bacterium]|nr:MAG: N-acetyltransferase [Spirochaetaceae bacterium]
MDHFITPLTDACLPETRQILLDAAAVDGFISTRSREQFCYAYFGYYREAAPELFLVAFGKPPLPEKVLGYVCAVADTRNHPELYRLAPHIPLFDDLYDRFPAHFHIIIDASVRGRGVGTSLLGELEMRLRKSCGTSGLHLVTGEGSRCVNFYRKNGFTFEAARDDEAGSEPRLLFMGRQLREP